MSIYELFIIALALSMDAFAVAVGKGLCVQRLKPMHSLKVGLWFGGFQALMPILGYYLGVHFSTYVEAFDHWIAFVLLAIIGGNMIKEAFKKDECDKKSADFGFKTMLLLAVATSIDALIVGVTFAFLHVDIWMAVILIGVITFILSIIGLKLGNIYGTKYKSKAEIAGGIILILMGLKILLEHTVFV